MTRAVSKPVPEPMSKPVSEPVSKPIPKAMFRPMSKAVSRAMLKPMSKAMLKAIPKAMFRAMLKPMPKAMPETVSQTVCQMVPPGVTPMQDSIRDFAIFTGPGPLRSGLSSYLGRKHPGWWGKHIPTHPTSSGRPFCQPSWRGRRWWPPYLFPICLPRAVLPIRSVR